MAHIPEHIIRFIEYVPGPVKHAADAAAGVTVLATIAKWLPPTAAAFTIIWLGLQIYTFFEKRFLEKKKKSKD